MASKQRYGYVQHLHSMMPNMVLWELCENIQLDSGPAILSILIAYLRRSILIFSHKLLGLASVWFVRGFLTKILYMFGISLILTLGTAHCNVQDLTTLITEVLSWQSSLHCLMKKGLLWNVEFAVLWLTSVISSQSVFHVSLNALDTFSAAVMWCSCNPLFQGAVGWHDFLCATGVKFQLSVGYLLYTYGCVHTHTYRPAP